MKTGIITLLSNRWVMIALYIFLAIVSVIQSLTTESPVSSYLSHSYANHHQYLVFKQSFSSILHADDLYIVYLGEHLQLYNYTPTFSVFFGIFAMLPDTVGLLLWNMANCMLLLAAVYMLPKLDMLQKGTVLFIIIFELMTCMQNEQSTGLMAGLLVMTFVLLERKHYFWAVCCLVFIFYIKLYAICALALLLLYPKKWRLAVYSFFWSLIFFMVPFIFIGWHQTTLLFQSIIGVFGHDHTASEGLSVMGWLEAWFGWRPSKIGVTLFGFFLFVLPMLRFKYHQNYTYRYLMVVSTLLWMIVFNHRADSPSYIIAMVGVALWFMTSTDSNLNIILFAAAIIFTSLSPTDIFPDYLRVVWVKPYMLKAVPCIFIWMKVVYDLLVIKEDTLSVDKQIMETERLHMTQAHGEHKKKSRN